MRAELVGTGGSATLAGHPGTRLDTALMSTRRHAADWRPRFREAYRLQNRAWINAITTDTPSPTAANAWDGYCAAIAAEAAATALSTGRRTGVQLAEQPALYPRAGGVA